MKKILLSMLFVIVITDNTFSQTPDDAVQVPPKVSEWLNYVLLTTSADSEQGVIAKVLSRFSENNNCIPMEIDNSAPWSFNHPSHNGRLTSFGIPFQRYKIVKLISYSQGGCQDDSFRIESETIMFANRSVTCPEGSRGHGFFSHPGSICITDIEELADEDLGGDCNDTQSSSNYSANPCNIATGNKFRSETDVTTGRLQFTRYYNSQSPNVYSYMGDHWSHNYHRSLVIGTTNVLFMSASGKSELFNLTGTGQDQWQPEQDSRYLLERNDGVFTLTLPNGAIERYADNGALLGQTDTNGHSVNYEYIDYQGTLPIYLLSKVSDQYGNSINFEYEYVKRFSDEEEPRLKSVTDSFGAVFEYHYDDVWNLISVSYPDTTPENNDDNPRKTYHYENQNFPNHLTGITDENGDRYANFAYDDEGNAILSELGETTNPVGQEKIQLDFQGTN